MKQDSKEEIIISKLNTIIDRLETIISKDNFYHRHKQWREISPRALSYIIIFLTTILVAHNYDYFNIGLMWFTIIGVLVLIGILWMDAVWTVRKTQ